MKTKTDLQIALDSYVKLGGSLDDLTVTTRHIVEGRLWYRHRLSPSYDPQAFDDWDEAVQAANALCQKILDDLDRPLRDNHFSVCVHRDVPVVILPDPYDIDLPNGAEDSDGTIYRYGFDFTDGLVVAYDYDELVDELPDMTLRNDRDMWFKA